MYLKKKYYFNLLLFTINIANGVFFAIGLTSFSNSPIKYKNRVTEQQHRILAYWNFEKIEHLDGSFSPSKPGESLIADEHHKPIEPNPYIADITGNGNLIQSNLAGNSPLLFSNNVPATEINGEPNIRSLSLKKGEYIVSELRPLPFYHMQKSWKIEVSLMNNSLGTEAVFLCKEGSEGQLSGDLSLGFDNMQKKYFVEVFCADGQPRRIVAGSEVEAGKWYDVCARADYDIKKDQTTMQIEVKASSEKSFGESARIIFKGEAMRSDAGRWIIGRGFPGGFPNNLSVLDGGIDEVRIFGEELPRVAGQNPLFTDAFTADPAALVVGDRVYVYVGQDKASPGGWFHMPNWLCYSTTDMKHWTAHGSVLAASDFENANSGSAWAAQVVEKDGKYYFYVTLDRKEGHFITVAVGDSPTGPFKEARPGKPLITDDMTTDSHRWNSDIDPTVLIDEDNTPWMAWGNGDCYMVKLNHNMVELDGLIKKVPFRNYSEGPWLFKRGNLYYNIYAADAPGVQPEQLCYSTAPAITGPWTYGGFITGPAKHGFTIHPSVIEFKNQWYLFYHDGAYMLNETPGGDCRRQVCAEYLFFNPGGSIKPITLTTTGISTPAK